MNNNIASLIAKVLSMEASEEEIAQVHSYLKDNPAEAAEFEMLRKLWPLSSEIKTENAAMVNNEDSERLNRILNKAVAERDKLNDFSPAKVDQVIAIKEIGIKFLKYAAVLLIVVTATLYFIGRNNRASTSVVATNLVEIAAENGSRKRVLLPDGSTVLLNAGSKIVYAEKFENDTREVTLFGEAFFDVVKQPSRAFIVHAANINIKVLGTAFNVKSYAEDDAVETTLIRGLVEINRENPGDNKSIYLHPNEKIRVSRCADCTPAEKSNANTAGTKQLIGRIVNLDSTLKEKELLETAWIYNRLEFKKTSFREIARQFERWYDVKIFITEESLAAIKFNGSFENETLEQALMALQKTTPFKFTINKNEVFINLPD
ncbi:MAG: FecR domain-containing protein [Bacteroidota bacterium]